MDVQRTRSRVRAGALAVTALLAAGTATAALGTGATEAAFTSQATARANASAATLGTPTNFKCVNDGDQKVILSATPNVDSTKMEFSWRGIWSTAGNNSVPITLDDYSLIDVDRRDNVYFRSVREFSGGSGRWESEVRGSIEVHLDRDVWQLGRRELECTTIVQPSGATHSIAPSGSSVAPAPEGNESPASKPDGGGDSSEPATPSDEGTESTKPPEPEESDPPAEPSDSSAATGAAGTS